MSNPSASSPMQQLLRSVLASVIAFALLAVSFVAVEAFVGPIASPTTSGFTSSVSTVATMSGSLTAIMGTSFTTATDALTAIATVLDGKLS